MNCRSYISAYEISRKIDASIYGCIYIAMSDIYKAPLITADKKLYESAKNLNFNVVFLDDFASM
ncbi:MAG TPA: type II toxin-antitoxin system VapC family toxin [Candidatus Hydromicrobium sp.]